MANSDLLPDLREAVDEAITREGWVMRDEFGHVEVFDGDINTADVSQAIIELLFQKGWVFTYVQS